jgi:hypothetical protein
MTREEGTLHRTGKGQIRVTQATLWHGACVRRDQVLPARGRSPAFQDRPWPVGVGLTHRGVLSCCARHVARRAACREPVPVDASTASFARPPMTGHASTPGRVQAAGSQR